MILRSAALVAVLVVPFTLPAQARADSAAANPITTSFKFISARFGGYLQAAFDSIPADRYAYRPTPPQQSVGYIAQHLNEANYALCERLGPLKRAPETRTTASDSVQASWAKDTLVARLKGSFRFCDAAFAQLTDEALGRRVAYGPPQYPATALPARSLVLFITDLAEHYSQLSGYMRQMGMVPPSALQAKSHAAIAVTPALLSRYVGSYNLPASEYSDSPAFMLDVTLIGDALQLSPRPRPPVRLWPESATDFFVREVDAQVTFVSDATGAVTGLVLHQNGEHRPAAKVK